MSGWAPVAAAWLAPIVAVSVLRHPVARLQQSGGGVPVVALPRRDSRSGRRDRQAAVLLALPEAVVLVKLAIGAGLTVPGALRAVGDRLPGVVGSAFSHCILCVDNGWRVADAIDQLREELSPHGDAFATLLHAGLRDGGTVGASFDVLAHELRSARRRAAEIRARRVPVLLLFPLVLCVLPAFVLLAIVPLLAGALTGVAGG